MPKYMVEASYTVEGLKGLQRDKATGRRMAISQAVAAAGGRLETFYCALGERDVVLIMDMPDLVAVTALSLAISATGLAHTKTTALLTVEETDEALEMSIAYRGPGR